MNFSMLLGLLLSFAIASCSKVEDIIDSKLQYKKLSRKVF